MHLVERHNGEDYVNSPYALVWNGDWYYLLGYSDVRRKVVTFRVDRMKMPKILVDIGASHHYVIQRYLSMAVSGIGTKAADMPICRRAV